MGKMLTESVIEKVEKICESSNVQVLDVDAVKTLLESEGATIQDSRLNAGIKMMQLQEKYINESNVSANIEPFTKKLQPLLRRVIPNTLAFDIAGVQPVESPDSAVYAIKSKYAGSKTNPISNTAKLLTYTAITALTAGDDITTEGGATGVVKYVETFKTEAGVASERAVIEVTAGTVINGEKFDKGTTYTADADDNTVTGVYSTESAFKQILEKYSGPYTTAEGEVLGDEMNQLKVVVEKMPVSVQTRALKAEFTAEMAQDLAKIHGANAEQELMTFLATEMNLDLDRTIISKYKEVATVNPNYVVNTFGRWSMEQYAGLYQKVLKSANDLALKNRRGKGNKMLATSGVISALEALGKFKTTSYEQSVKTGENQATAFVGVLQNGIAVYQDWFATEEYFLVIYKGGSEMDNGVIYSPYVPLYFVDALDAKTLQPVIGCKTRDSLTVNTLMDDEAGSSYASMTVVDFVSTPIAD